MPANHDGEVDEDVDADDDDDYAVEMWSKPKTLNRHEDADDDKGDWAVSIVLSGSGSRGPQQEWALVPSTQWRTSEKPRT